MTSSSTNFLGLRLDRQYPPKSVAGKLLCKNIQCHIIHSEGVLKWAKLILIFHNISTLRRAKVFANSCGAVLCQSRPWMHTCECSMKLLCRKTFKFTIYSSKNSCSHGLNVSSPLVPVDHFMWSCWIQHGNHRPRKVLKSRSFLLPSFPPKYASCFTTCLAKWLQMDALTF